jgi:cardiolipin synthase
MDHPKRNFITPLKESEVPCFPYHEHHFASFQVRQLCLKWKREDLLMQDPFSIPSIEKLFKEKFSLATHVQLVWKGEDSFKTIFDAITEAERLICLQFYIFKNDETGTALADLLKKKSQAGIKVYLLYDHFGSLGTPRSFWKELKMAGIKIRASHPFKWTAPFHYVHRDHRKLIVVDLKRAFTGGLNIANEYSGFHLRRRSRGWRDTGMMIEGPIVKELFETFKRSWYTWRGEKISLRKITHEKSTQRQRHTIPALPIFVYTRKGRKRMRLLLRYSIEHAKSTILLTTAYFIPSRKMLTLLEDAVIRGVKVRLLVPGKSDVPAASYAGRAFFSRLLKSGIEIYTYRGEMLHAKTYLFDEDWSIIGSTNLDYQSLVYNDEGNLGILNSTIVKKMTAIFEEDLRKSTKIELGKWRRRPLLEKMKEHLFALIRKRL